MPQAVTAWPKINDGDEVNASDFTAMGNSVRTLDANILQGLLGVPTAMPMLNPLTVTAPGGMAILVGGSGGQSVFLDSAAGARFVDQAPVQTLTLAASSSQPRNDLLCAQYTQSLTATGTRNNESTGGTITVVTANAENEALIYQVVQGTPADSPVDPGIPSGWVAIARIVVPASASAIVTGNISILPPTMQNLILSGITSSGYVDTTTNQTVAGNKTFSGVTTIGGIQFAYGDTPYAGVAGVRRNIPNSVIISPTAPGNGIYLGYDCNTLASVNFGPRNLWGYVDGGGFHSPDGTAVYGTNTNVGNGYVHAAQNGSPLHFIPQAGDFVADRGNGTGVIYLGNPQTNPGTRYLYCDGSNYSMPGGNLLLNGSFITSSGAFVVNNNGTANGGSINFGNSSSSNGQTQLGSNNVVVAGIHANLFHVGDNTGSTHVAFDSNGNVGIQNSLYTSNYLSSNYGMFNNGARIGSQSPQPNTAGDLCISRNSTPGTGYIFFNQAQNRYFGFDGTNFVTNAGLSVSGNASVTGTISVSGAILPNSYISGDSSINITQSGEQLNLRLPGGFVSSATSSDSSVNVSQSGRQLNLTLPGGFPDSFVTDGSLAITQSGRQLTLDLNQRGGTIPPVYNQSGGNINSGLKIVTGQTFVASNTTVTVNLSGNSVFSTTGTYQVTASTIYGLFPLVVQVNNVSGGQFALTVYELSGGGWSSSAAPNVTVSWIAIGY